MVQREKMGCNAVVAKISPDPIKNLVGRLLLLRCPMLG